MRGDIMSETLFRSNQALRRLRREAVRQGWTVESRGSRGNHHVGWRSPGGQLVISGSGCHISQQAIAKHVRLMQAQGFR
jgi:hypothetical protein